MEEVGGGVSRGGRSYIGHLPLIPESGQRFVLSSSIARRQRILLADSKYCEQQGSSLRLCWVSSASVFFCVVAPLMILACCQAGTLMAYAHCGADKPGRL